MHYRKTQEERRLDVLGMFFRGFWKRTWTILGKGILIRGNIGAQVVGRIKVKLSYIDY